MRRGCNYGRFLNIPEFWVYQVSAYANLVLNNPQVLNMLGLWIWQGYEYVRFTQGTEYTWVWICLNASMCVNMPQSCWIWLNMLVYTWKNRVLDMSEFWVCLQYIVKGHCTNYWAITKTETRQSHVVRTLPNI